MNNNNFKTRKINNRFIDLLSEIEFHAMLWKHDTQFKRLPVDVNSGINDLLDSIRIAKTMNEAKKRFTDKSKNIMHSETNRYIAIFKTKYLELTDFEYEEKVNATAFVIVKTLVTKLIDSGSSVSEYLVWFFDDFLAEPKNQKLCPPNIGLSVSKNISSVFFFRMKDKLKTRRKDTEEATKRKALLMIASDMFDSTSDVEIGETLLKFGSNKLTFNNAKKTFLDYAEKENMHDFAEKIKLI